MKSLKIVLSLVFACLIVLSVKASEAEYDLRFVQVESQQTGIALVDIEISATASDKEFFLAEQNFRFSFNEAAVMLYNTDLPSVSIKQELNVSGQTAQSFYAPHHLNGSAGNIISYNVELVGGQGSHITANEWTKVGRLAFKLKSPNAQLELTWQSTENFPATFIIEKKNEGFTRISQGNLENFTAMTVDIENPIAANDVINVFPNPATANSAINLTIDSESTRGMGNIIIADALGRTISTQAVSIEKGMQNYTLNLQALSAGTYHVHLQTTQWKSISKPLIIIEK